MTWWSRFVTSFTILFALALPPQTQSPTVIDGLVAYASGDYARALGPIKRLADVDAVFLGLTNSAAGWIDSSGRPSSQFGRRLVVASFALEAAASSFEIPASRDGREAAVRSRLKLISWAASVLTKDLKSGVALAVDGQERPWFMAAISFLEADNWLGLIDLPPWLSGLFPQGQLSGKRESVDLRLQPLLTLALQRFPTDDFLLLEQAKVEEHFGLPNGMFPGQPIREIQSVFEITFDRVNGRAFGDDQDRLLQAARAHYKKLMSSKSVGAEAYLRNGFIQLMLGDRSRARDDFSSATKLTTDRDILYLSSFLSGWSWNRDRRVAEAEKALRDALAAAPRARSAAIVLAAVLYATNRRDDASELLQETLFASPAPRDPWNDALRGRAPLWLSDLEVLRGTLR